MRRWLIALVLLALPVYANDLDVETGYALGSGPYFQLRYNYPLARLNLPGEPYVWLLPELGLFSDPKENYLRLQVLLDTERWTAVVDGRWRGAEWLWRIALRFTLR
jgi:hypothetical protein